MKLSEIPTCKLPNGMPHTPAYSDAGDKGKLLLRFKRYEPIIDEVARITGYVSANIICRRNDVRQLVQIVVIRTGAKTCLHLDPWSLGKVNGVKKFINLHPRWRWRRHIKQIVEYLMAWNQYAVPRWINWYDEAVRITPENARAVWRRQAELCMALQDVCPAAIVAPYNLRMVREHDVYPFTSPNLPGPSQASTYWEGATRNYKYLCDADDVFYTFGWPLVANVMLHRWRVDKGRYLKIKAKPEHFKELGEFIRSFKCQACILSEAKFVRQGVPNKHVAANLGALVKGINSD